MISVKQLAERLTEHDYDKKCPFCSKNDWGEEKHSADCPFAMAYQVLGVTTPPPDKSRELCPEHGKPVNSTGLYYECLCPR